MAIIEIDQDNRIVSDPLQWSFERRFVHGKTGEEYWRAMGIYHSNLECMIQAVAQRLLRESDVVGVLALREEAERIGKRLTEALTPHITINLKSIRG